jgi:uncharacterized membrane protein YgcG
MTDRLRHPWLVAPCLALGCVALAGCGAGAGNSGAQSESASASSPPALALTAPTSGATVGVHQIVVAGKVTPQNAVVRVAGQLATISKGTFKRTLWLGRSTTTIQITAATPGHAPTSVTTVVHFSPQLAVALVAARKAAVSTTRALASVTPSPNAKGPAIPVVRHPAPVSPAAVPGATLTAPTMATPAPSSSPSGGSAGGSSGGSGTAPAPSKGSGSKGSGSTPTTPVPLTPAQIQQRYLKGCAAADGGQSALPYCTCMYDHLAQAGALASPATIATLADELNVFGQTNDIFALPAFLRNALIDCASELPDPPLPVAKLPSLDHPLAGPKATATNPVQGSRQRP